MSWSTPRKRPGVLKRVVFTGLVVAAAIPILIMAMAYYTFSGEIPEEFFHER